MKNQSIYDAALRLLAESTVAGENADYEERAPFLLAAFCTETAHLDSRYRHAADSEVVLREAVCLPLEEEFPLSDRFTTAAALYLAAMLILDSDEERSDKLYAQYCDAIMRISQAIPATLMPITDKYF